MQISVVIGTYNQKDTLKIVLDSLFKQTLAPTEYEIVLVDSFSTDGTDAMVEQLSPSCRLNYLRLENHGKSFARNRGIEAAKGNIILLTDADMLAAPTLLEEHLKTHIAYPSAAIEGITFNLNKNIPSDVIHPKHPDITPYIKEKIRPFAKIKWAYFLSGNLSVPRKILLANGSFDENFSGYGWEDIELGYRLHKKGIKLIYNPQAINYHYHLVGNEDMLKRKYNMGKSAAYFYKKHPNFEIKMFLGMNPLAMGIFHWLKNHPQQLKKIRNQYLLEEYYYRLGLTEALG